MAWAHPRTTGPGPKASAAPAARGRRQRRRRPQAWSLAAAGALAADDGRVTPKSACLMRLWTWSIAALVGCLGCQCFGRRSRVDLIAGLSPCAAATLFDLRIDCAACTNNMCHTRLRSAHRDVTSCDCRSSWCNEACFSAWSDALNPRAAARFLEALEPPAVMDRQGRGILRADVPSACRV